jgi:hypothetical protein
MVPNIEKRLADEDDAADYLTTQRSFLVVVIPEWHTDLDATRVEDDVMVAVDITAADDSAPLLYCCCCC